MRRSSGGRESTAGALGRLPSRGRRVSALVARGSRGRTPATPPGGRFQANQPMGSAQPGVSQLEFARSSKLPLGSRGRPRRMVGRPGPERVVMPLVLDAGVEPIPGYLLVRPLGRGGFGEVWEATAPGAIRVALKFIRLGTEEAGSEQRALEVIRDIRHPHLLDVQFAVRVDDCLIMAMPLCEQSLMDRLRACQREGEPGLPRDELLGYMDELAQAVDYLNEPRHRSPDGTLVGVQHRDIKPHNVFLVGGSVRLADFGVAKILEATMATHTGKMSAHYVAPEVLKGHVSRWSD